MTIERGAEFWTDPQVAVDPSDAELAMAARSMIAARRALAEHLPIDFIHDPSLDTLMTLFVATVEHREVTAEAVCAATSVDWLVLSRWLQALAAQGLIAAPMPVARTSVVALTGPGRETVGATIAAVIRSQVELYAD